MEPRQGETFVDFCLRCALRHDTSMSRAMLRALGFPARDPMPEGVIVRADRFDGLRECFANRSRPNL